MSRKFEYVIVQLADNSRNERLNAALVIFSETGLDVRIPRRLEKLRALSSAIDLDSVRFAMKQLEHFDLILRDQGRSMLVDRLQALTVLSPFEFSPPSYFFAPSVAAYEDWATRLLKTLVEPEPVRSKPHLKRTRLLSIMRSAFRSERVLAKRGEDISNHRVVSNVMIAEGLSADFVLKNGAMHVIDTVDASHENSSARKIVTDIAVSALVLEQARMKFGESSTESCLVYEASASVEKIAAPSLEAAAHQGTKLVNWASGDDRLRFITNLSRLATPYEKKPVTKLATLHASTQHKFDLN